MRNLFFSVLFFFTLFIPSFNSLAVPTEEPHFSAKGVITQVDETAKVIYLKNEGGLELSFHVKDAANLTGLKPEDEVTIDYLYNENYEKMINKIEKKSPNSSPENPKPQTSS